MDYQNQTRIATAVLRKRIKQTLDSFLAPGIEEIVASYFPACCECKSIQNISIVCVACCRYYCCNCASEACDEGYGPEDQRTYVDDQLVLDDCDTCLYGE